MGTHAVITHMACRIKHPGTVQSNPTTVIHEKYTLIEIKVIPRHLDQYSSMIDLPQRHGLYRVFLKVIKYYTPQDTIRSATYKN